MGISRSGYAAWCRRRHQPPSLRQQEKQQAEARLRLQIRRLQIRRLHIRAAHRTGRHYSGSLRPGGTRSTMSYQSKAFTSAASEALGSCARRGWLDAGGHDAGLLPLLPLINTVRRHWALGHKSPIAFGLAYHLNPS
jgi:hypothetical protein